VPVMGAVAWLTLPLLARPDTFSSIGPTRGILMLGVHVALVLVVEQLLSVAMLMVTGGAAPSW
jgi:hypothetical protein